ncbi:hypothetical protein Ppro_0277 [Pelobacter propionicus DSM 2379]|uniref:Uncharacterized protein n=1 Tax=Pelobacter propionicus (strain DSM 2379 / NBRC 103807 / OttBd1) TaxID=338966 RepID=A1AKP1_PELPD|nr:hypothetical protein Ppro_0277 [Pelobacter propionicus DSM 2379]
MWSQMVSVNNSFTSQIHITAELHNNKTAHSVCLSVLIACRGSQALCRMCFEARKQYDLSTNETNPSYHLIRFVALLGVDIFS